MLDIYWHEVSSELAKTTTKSTRITAVIFMNWVLIEDWMLFITKKQNAVHHISKWLLVISFFILLCRHWLMQFILHTKCCPAPCSVKSIEVKWQKSIINSFHFYQNWEIDCCLYTFLWPGSLLPPSCSLCGDLSSGMKAVSQVFSSECTSVVIQFLVCLCGDGIEGSHMIKSHLLM